MYMQMGMLIWTLLKQETVNDNGINWAICKHAPHSKYIAMPAFQQMITVNMARLSAENTNSQYTANTNTVVKVATSRSTITGTHFFFQTHYLHDTSESKHSITNVKTSRNILLPQYDNTIMVNRTTCIGIRIA